MPTLSILIGLIPPVWHEAEELACQNDLEIFPQLVYEVAQPVWRAAGPSVKHHP